MKNTAAAGVLSLLLSPLFCHAQGLASIVGTVSDPSGAAIASAKITATQADTNFSRVAISNGDGSYVLSSLRPAVYTLRAEARGFRLEKLTVTLLADQSLTVNVKMQLGMANQVVEVQIDTLESTPRRPRSIRSSSSNASGSCRLTDATPPRSPFW